MAQTKVVIVYSPNQFVRRTVIIPDDDSQIPIHVANLQPGEAVMVGLLADYRQMGPDAMLALHTGRSPGSDRCIVVGPDSKVIAVMHGDPLIDRHPAGTVLLDVTGRAFVGLPVVNSVAQTPLS